MNKFVDTIVLVASIVLALVLGAAHWSYLQNVHSGGLFQIFGNIFAGIFSLALLTNTYSGKISRSKGYLSALIVGLTSMYCFWHSFGLMMSI